MFSAASHDRNPLLISEEYARATPYGEPVVFGIVGALAALGQLPQQEERVLQRVELEFRNPLTVGMPYLVKVGEPSTDRASVRLYDAARLMLKATFRFLPGPKQARAHSIKEAPGPTEAEDRQRGSFRVGDCVRGIYGPVTRPLGAYFQGSDRDADRGNDVGKFYGRNEIARKTRDVLAIDARFPS